MTRATRPSEGIPQGACPECGAPIPAGGTCKDNFYALLLLESEVPGGPGTVAHFYAVASYGLQHPESMGFTAATLAGLLGQLEAVLSGEASIEDVRRSVRARAKEAGRVTRRPGDVVPHWPLSDWPMTVTDVLEGGAEAYKDSVEAWARSVVAALAPFAS